MSSYGSLTGHEPSCLGSGCTPPAWHRGFESLSCTTVTATVIPVCVVVAVGQPNVSPPQPRWATWRPDLPRKRNISRQKHVRGIPLPYTARRRPTLPPPTGKVSATRPPPTGKVYCRWDPVPSLSNIRERQPGTPGTCSPPEKSSSGQLR